MAAPAADALAGRLAVLATMHGKEAAIAPLLARFMGLRVTLPQGFDSDRFGTFSRDVPRPGSALDTARAKIAGAFACTPDATLGLASEGSYGPHPGLPFLTFGTELVLLVDRRSGLELAGWHRAPAAYAAGWRVDSIDALRAVAARAGFPTQGLIACALRDGQPAPQLGLFKQLQTQPELEQAVAGLLSAHGEAWVEADLRANRCPPRMRRIRRAAFALVRAWYSRCPACGHPGFIPQASIPGLPCALCLRPTGLARAHRLSCAACGHAKEHPVRVTLADPAHCDACNP